MAPRRCSCSRYSVPARGQESWSCCWTSQPGAASHSPPTRALGVGQRHQPRGHRRWRPGREPLVWVRGCSWGAQPMAEDQVRAALPGPAWFSWAGFHHPAAPREPSREHGLPGEAGGGMARAGAAHRLCRAAAQGRSGMAARTPPRTRHHFSSRRTVLSPIRNLWGGKKDRNSGSALLPLQASETQRQPEPRFTPREDTVRTDKHEESEAGWIFAVTLSSWGREGKGASNACTSLERSSCLQP